MATRIKPLRTEVATRIPSHSALEYGEIAVNIQDGKIYTKTRDGEFY